MPVALTSIDIQRRLQEVDTATTVAEVRDTTCLFCGVRGIAIDQLPDWVMCRIQDRVAAINGEMLDLVGGQLGAHAAVPIRARRSATTRS
jgi:hypothetical protein